MGHKAIYGLFYSVFLCLAKLIIINSQIYHRSLVSKNLKCVYIQSQASLMSHEEVMAFSSSKRGGQRKLT